MSIRHQTAEAWIKKNKPLGTVLGARAGRVLWVDERDSLGLIKTDDGEEYLFSLGREGHIGVYTPSSMLPGESSPVSDDRVEFVGVDHMYSTQKYAFEIRILEVE